MFSPAPKMLDTKSKTGSQTMAGAGKGAFFQAKLRVNTPGDEHEKEADANADRVMRMKDGEQASFQTAAAPVTSIYRKAEKEEDEMPVVQRVAEDEKEEHEASGEKIQRSEGGDPSSAKEQLAMASEKSEDEPEAGVQRKSAATGGFQAGPFFSAKLAASKSGGESMPTPTKAFMETRMQADFSQTRIHRDGPADEMSRDINARAFTHKNDVYFRGGEFQPETDGGKRLLAHELTHVLQQNPGVSRKVSAETEGFVARGAEVQRQVAATGFHRNYGTLTNTGQTYETYKNGLGELKSTSSQTKNGTINLRPLTLGSLLEIMESPEAKKFSLDFSGKANNLREGAIRAALQQYAERLNQSFRLMKIDTVEAQAAYISNALVESKGFQYFVETASTKRENATYLKAGEANDPNPAAALKLSESALTEAATKGTMGGAKVNQQTYKLLNKDGGDWHDSLIGRGPLQVTGSNSYLQSLAMLEKRAEDPTLEAADAKFLNEAVAAIKSDPEQASNPRYAFLFSAAFMKFDRHGKGGDVSATGGSVTGFMGQQFAEHKREKEAIFPKAKKILIAKMAESPVQDANKIDRNEPQEAPKTSTGEGQTAKTLEKPVGLLGTKTADAAPKTDIVDKTGIETEEGSAAKSADAEALPTEAAEGPAAEPVSPQNPKDDPAFKQVVDDSKKSATGQKAHGAPAEKAEAARLGAVAPASELDSKAQAGQVGKMAEQPKGKFDKEGFKKILKEKIEAAMPKNEDEAKNYKENNRLGEVKDDLKKDVKKEKEAAAGPIEGATKEAPDKNKVQPEAHEDMKPEEKGSKPRVPNPQAAAPKPKTDGEVSMEKEAQSLDTEMDKSGVTEEVLENSNEPTFNDALQSKRDSQASARQAPADYRKQEGPMVDEAKGGAKEEVAGKMGEMFSARAGAFGKVDKDKNSAKTKNEEKRKAVADLLNGIYTKTKTGVEKKLGDLEKTVVDEFDKKTKTANEEFGFDFGKRASEYYDGPWNTVRNFVAGVPKEVENIFHEEKKKFMTKMDTALDEIAGMVETGLNDAMTMIADGRKEIDAEVKKLAPDLQSIGKEIAGGLAGKFDALEQSVEDKQGQLADALSAKYVEQVQKMNEKLETIKAEQKGLIGRAKDAIVGIINTILELKAMLEQLLAKAKKVVGDIIRDPGKFFDNFSAAIKKGLNNFTDNFLNHLKTGFFTWLMGNMPPGIVFPKEWDVKGIFSFIAQILGLSWANIRARVAKKLGEPVVKALETVFDIFQIILTKGLAGLWEFIKEKVGNLKTMVIDAIMDFLESAVVKAGISWIIGMLNPAGALIKICQAIYGIVKFILEKGKQIIEFFNSIVDSAADIVAGKLGFAAKKVEDSLAKAIPLAIGFLAGLLGLGDISKKVQEIIKKVQAPINKAIDWVVDKAVAFAKKLGIDKLVAKVKGGVAKGKDWVKGKVEKVKEKGKAVAGKILGFFGVKTKFTDGKGAGHSIYYQQSGGKAVLMVASNPMNINAFLDFYVNQYDIEPSSEKGKEVKGIREFVKNNIGPKVAVIDKSKEPEKETILQKELLEQNVVLSQMLQKLMLGNKAVGEIIDSYRLEGLTGTYGSMPKPVKDRMTPDHQPQNAVLTEAAKEPYFDGDGEMRDRARYNNGYAINLYHTRHVEGRTYGGKSSGTIKVFKSELKKALVGKNTDQEKRNAVVEVLRACLQADVDVMKKVAANDSSFTDFDALEMDKNEKTNLKESVKKRIVEGENQILNQDLERLKKS